MLPIQVNESVAERRRVTFSLVGTDGITPALDEAGGQPEVEIGVGAGFGTTGIGVLVSQGGGDYYAELTTGALATAGKRLRTRYKSVNTATCPGDTVFVVDYDPITNNTPEQGNGDVEVDHDTGGIDNLRYEEGDAGIDDAVILAYRTSDYETGVYVVRGRSYTDSEGRWVRPMYLEAGDYTITFDHDEFETSEKTVTVS